MVTYIVRGCTGCDSCRWVCPVGAIRFDHTGAHIDNGKCIRCGKCVETCASEAIRAIETKGERK